MKNEKNFADLSRHTLLCHTFFESLKSEIENTTQNEDERLKMMIELGGYNSWIAWIAGIIIALDVLIVLAVAIPKITSSLKEFQVFLV